MKSQKRLFTFADISHRSSLIVAIYSKTVINIEYGILLATHSLSNLMISKITLISKLEVKKFVCFKKSIRCVS